MSGAKDPFRYFRIEARELLDSMQRQIIALGEPPDPEQIRTLMRASHTLKGAAGVVRQAAIANHAHKLEDLLGAGAKSPDLLSLLDAIERELALLATPAAETGATVQATPPVIAAESVRLDLAEVDALLASLGELVARIAALRSKADSPELESVEHRAHDALEDARRLRLLPAETVFAEVARAAHDAASREGRLVEVTTAGGDKRVDAQVLAVVRDALLQLVRNAIAHGIEPAAERAQAGKPKAGVIAIRVEIRGPRAIIAVRDDGRGLDLDAMRTALRANPGADATATVLLAVRAGVTTRAKASELAGRGVGLQVVGAAVDRLRGTLRVETTPGLGTEIALDVPVSITAAPALLVEAGGQIVSVPLDAIARTTRIAASDVTRTAEGDAITDEGKTYRFGALARLLDARNVETPVNWTVLLVGGVAVGIDRVHGIANEVLRALPPHAVSAPIISGASLDGDGNPRLAIDPAVLAAEVEKLPSAPIKSTAREPARILVCDDSLTSRMLEQSILEAAGYFVTTATSGEDALVKARLQKFSLFVVDVEMPGMTGFETVGRLRADPQLGSIPAVLVTSRAAADDRRRGLEAGARAYIIKGEFAQTEFLETVRRLIG